MEIHMDMKSKQLWLSEQSYVEKVLDKFNISNEKLVSTPLAKHFKLYVDQCSKTNAKVEYMSIYVSEIGCLMYVMVCTRPNLTHDVSQIYKFGS